MKTKIRIIFFLSVVLIYTIVGICSANDTLVFGISTDVNELDPGNSIGFYVVDNLFEGLVKFKSGSTNIEPCLASSWEISGNGKEITFYLRKGIQFHDGTAFNADAVIFSFARQYDPNHPYHQFGKWAVWSSMFSGDIDRIEKIDDYTVKLVLKRPSASILSNLAMCAMSIVSPTNAKQYKEEAFKYPCGTGPFKFVEWVKDDHITLEANENYWRERAKLDRLIFKVIPDPSARLMALEVDEVQGIEYPDPVDFNRIKENDDLVLITEPGMNVGFIAMNTGYGYMDSNKNGLKDANEPLVKTPGYFEPLTKKNVRQAINMAIDKQSIIDNIYMGRAIKAKNGMPPFMLGYNDKIKDYPYDLERAKELLAESGYPNGFEVTLHITPVSRPYMFDPPRIAEAIQSYLAAVGIKVKIFQLDLSYFLLELLEGKHQMCLGGWFGDNGDPDNFMNVAYGTNSTSIGTAANFAFYINEQAQELLSKALVTYDEEERATYYREVQEMIHEDAGWVYLAHETLNMVVWNNIKGFVPNPTGRLFFYPVWIE
jgi:peptide/nickel transport system substrate-binding protein